MKKYKVTFSRANVEIVVEVHDTEDNATLSEVVAHGWEHAIKSFTHKIEEIKYD